MPRLSAAHWDWQKLNNTDAVLYHMQGAVGNTPDAIGLGSDKGAVPVRIRAVKVWTEIAPERLAGNFRALSVIVGESLGEGKAPALLAVIKANAYGHGIDPCAAILAHAGAEWLGVTDAHEGARVRTVLAAAMERDDSSPSRNRDSIHRAPVQPRILVMSGTVGLAGEADCIVENALTPVVWASAHVTLLAEAARKAGRATRVPVHVEIDSGMSRQGVSPGALLAETLQAIAAEPSVVLDGVFTHFASTEISGSEQTTRQQAQFESAIAQIARSGAKPRWVHVGNSSFIDNAVPSTSISDQEACEWAPGKWLSSLAEASQARPMVRTGLALYGYLLPIEGLGRSLAASNVLPVMAWKTRLIDVREVPVGTLVGYDGAYRAARPMRLALLPLGYADGLRRELSSTNTKVGGWVIIRGECAAIVGRVSMNLTTVDVTAIPGATDGDEVVVLGDGVNANDHARLAGTIAYEILCGIKTAE